MTTTLSTKVSLSVIANAVETLDLVDARSPLSRAWTVMLASGTGAGKADLVFSDTRTVAASSNDDLDLAGSLTDSFGATITMVRVKALIVHADPDNTNNVIVGGDATNTFLTWVGAETDTVILRPGATLALFAGDDDATAYAITATTGDLLRITNSGSGATVGYDIVVIGASA